MEITRQARQVRRQYPLISHTYKMSGLISLTCLPCLVRVNTHKMKTNKQTNHSSQAVAGGCLSK